eukprot:scaffold9124_cov101-Isochrysis_galbana.AAC.7
MAAPHCRKKYLVEPMSDVRHVAKRKATKKHALFRSLLARSSSFFPNLNLKPKPTTATIHNI